ncbi:MAG: DUF4292 domain-containing protein [Bacteroidia bacterium]|nr:DUF4292 domain-containing protein [Bacteroidia bacterium]
MKNRTVVYYTFLFCFIFFSACRSVQKTKSIDVSEGSIQSYWDNQFDTDYVEVRGKSAIIDGNKTTNVSLHLKMKKDSIIWAKFSLFGFGINALITSDSFFMVNSVLQEYMAYDHQILEQYLGFKPRLEQVQNMLLGNAIFPKNRYFLNGENTLLAREGLAKNMIQLNPKYRTFQSDIMAQDTSQLATINYNQYEFVEEIGLLPRFINIDIQQGEEKIQMELNYQNIKTNKITVFPFRIPSSYIRK